MHAPVMMTLEAEQSSEQLAELQADLVEFEERYGMSSDEFYGRFQNGKTVDRMGFVEWASLVQMRDNPALRVRLLK